MKNISNVVAAIKAGDEKLLRDYIEKILIFNQQCRDAVNSLNKSEDGFSISAKVSYQVVYRILFGNTEFSPQSLDEVLFVLLVVVIHYRQDKLISLLFEYNIKNISSSDIKTLLFGIMSLSGKDNQEPLDKIFHKLLEKFAAKLTDKDDILGLVIYAVHLKLTNIVCSLADLCEKRQIFGTPSILDCLVATENLYNKYYYLPKKIDFFNLNFLRLNIKRALLNPLHMAASDNNIKMVTVLLAAGANDVPPGETFAQHDINDAWHDIIKTNNNKMLTIFLSQGIGIFRTLQKQKLETVLQDEAVDKILLLECTFIDANNKSVASKAFKHPKVISTIEALKKVPVTSEEDVKLFERWYVSICHAQANLFGYKGFVDQAMHSELEQWKFAILNSISRRSPMASLMKHCLFAIKQNMLEEPPMQRLNKLNNDILRKLHQFPYANPAKAEEQFFSLVWNDYLTYCGDKNIHALDTYIVKLVAERKKCDDAVKKYIDEIAKQYKEEIKKPVFNRIVFHQLKEILIDNALKDPKSRDEFLFQNSLEILEVTIPQFDKDTPAKDKKTWLENNLSIREPAKYHLVYFLVKETNFNGMKFEEISIKSFMKHFFESIWRADFGGSKLVSFFNEKVLGALTVNKIKEDFQGFEHSFYDFYHSQQEGPGHY